MAVQVRIGRIKGADRVTELINAAVIKQIADAGIKRTQRRRPHPSTLALKSENRGSRRADIVGTRGGPGIIRPVTKQALFWPGARHPVAFVNGKGFGPLIEAETRRVSTNDIDIAAISAALK